MLFLCLHVNDVDLALFYGVSNERCFTSMRLVLLLLNGLFTNLMTSWLFVLDDGDRVNPQTRVYEVLHMP